eukprot:m.636916 g.636916  ORF g.636916 m.636916 type:complete len:667 (-) comp58315_c0_seq1:72-2072(-)
MEPTERAQPRGSIASIQQQQPTQDDASLADDSGSTWLTKSLSRAKKLLPSSNIEAFRTLFKEIPEAEPLLDDFSCALVKDRLLVHGRMYVSPNYIAFYSSIFGWETNLVLRCLEITEVKKEKTAYLIPNAVQLVTSEAKYLFSSFVSRSMAYRCLSIVTKNAHALLQMSAEDLIANYGKQWRADVENESTVNRFADSLADDIDDAPTESRNFNDWVQIDELADRGSQSSDAPVAPAATTEAATTTEAVTASVAATTAVAASSIVSGPTGAPSARAAPILVMPARPRADVAVAPIVRPPVSCPCTSHEGQQFLDTIIPCSIEFLYPLFFSDSEFFRILQRERNTDNWKIGEWNVGPAPPCRERHMTYMLALNYAIGPKQTQVVEKQRDLFPPKPGECYVVEGTVDTPNVPYGDQFYVQTRFCLTYQSANECRFKVFGAMKYHKKPWALIKGMIESQGYEGLKTFWARAQTLLLEHAKHYQAPQLTVDAPSPLPSATRHKRTDSSTSALSREISMKSAHSRTNSVTVEGDVLRTVTPTVSASHLEPVPSLEPVEEALPKVTWSWQRISQDRRGQFLFGALFALLLLSNFLMYSHLKSIQEEQAQGTAFSAQFWSDLPHACEQEGAATSCGSAAVQQLQQQLTDLQQDLQAALLRIRGFQDVLHALRPE